MKRALKEIIINSETLDEAVESIEKFIVNNTMKSIYCAICFAYDEFKKTN